MGLLHGVILYASTFIVLMGMGLIWDVWRHKDSFEIAARSPMLLCLAGAAHVALVFLQMTAGVRTSQSRCSLTVVALAESAHISPRQHKGSVGGKVSMHKVLRRHFVRMHVYTMD